MLTIPTHVLTWRGLCVCLSVCLSVGHTDQLYKNGRTDRDVVWGADWRGPRCYGNQLILGAGRRRQNRPRLLFVLAFHKELHYRHMNACINSGNDVDTSSNNLVNFRSVQD